MSDEVCAMELFNVFIGLASLGLMAWTLIVTIKANARMGTTTTAPPREETGRLSYWPVVGMAVLAVAVWIPYFLQIGHADRVLALSAWGNTPDGAYVVIDGSKLAAYNGKYDVGAAFGISNPTVDQFKDTKIIVSEMFTIIDGPIAIAAKNSSEMTETIKALASLNPPQAASIWHSVFLLPKKSDVSRIKRLGDIKDFGGKFVNNCQPIE
jgi:hypothetical protein